jgi:hypothetical protein
MYFTPKAWKVITLAVAILFALAENGWCVLPNKEQAFRDLFKKETVKWAFAPGDMPYAAAIVDYGGYGEFKVYSQKGKDIAVVAFGKMKPEQIANSACFFVMGGAHAVIALSEPFKDSTLTSLLVFNLAGPDPAAPVFSMQPVYDLRFEMASTDQLILWQKDRVFYNGGTPPFKFNYFLLTYDAALNRYTFDFLLRTLPAVQGDEGVVLNNSAVQLFRNGDVKGAAAKLESATLVANAGRGVIIDNRRYLERVRNVLLARQGASYEQPGAGFDDIKLSYLLGEFNQVLLSMQSGANARRGDRVALYGLCFAQVRDYDNLRKITKILTDTKYEKLADYLAEVSRIIFFHRDMEMLRAYLTALEEAGPGHPALAFLKAAVLADSGRLELAEQFLITFLARTRLDDSELGECREYLYEIASILGDLEVVNTMMARLTRETVWDMRDITYFVNYSGFLHTDLVKLGLGMGARLKAPEQPLETLGFDEGSAGTIGNGNNGGGG